MNLNHMRGSQKTLALFLCEKGEEAGGAKSPKWHRLAAGMSQHFWVRARMDASRLPLNFYFGSSSGGMNFSPQRAGKLVVLGFPPYGPGNPGRSPRTDYHNGEICSFNIGQSPSVPPSPKAGALTKRRKRRVKNTQGNNFINCIGKSRLLFTT